MEREKLIATVTAAQNGDSDALNELFNAFYNDVYYFALKTVKDEDLACDITQETFVEIINTICDLHEPAAFVKWMKQITYHQCTRYFKKKKDVLVDEDEEGNTVFDTLKEEKAEFIPDEALDQQDFRDTILAMLDELSEEQRSATMLYYYDELSVKQIAEIQNVSEGTVKSRLNYARKSIKNSVETYEKKNGIKLRSVGILPLLLWLLSQTGKETMPAAAANAVAGGVTAATGTTVVAASGSAAAATATAATATAAATATTATTAGTGIFAKLAALPIVAKVVAGVVAASVVAGGVGAAILVEKIPESAVPTTTVAMGSIPAQSTAAPAQPTTSVTETVCYIPDGCTYAMADGTILTAGQAMPKTTGEGDVFTTEEYTYTYLPSGWEVKVNDTTKSLYGTILSQVNQQPVTSMQKAFAGCANLITPPEIPGTIQNMQSAFFECSSLPTAPVIPEGVADMSNAFAYCTSLTSPPVIPESVTNLSGTFWNCTSLIAAPVIPKGVTDVTWMFYGCTSLTTAPAIPEGVTNMHETFGGCTSLTAAPVIPESVTDMSIAFSGCTSLLAAPTIPESVTNLSGTFWNCTSLIAAPVIPEGVTNLSMTFQGCTSLTGIIEINGVQKVCEFCKYYANNEADYVSEFDCEYCGSDGITCENCDVCSTILACFQDTVQPITLVGSSLCLPELAATGNNGNVKLETDVVYAQSDVESSIDLLESWSLDYPDFGESQTALTHFKRNYIISVSKTPICRIRSVDVVGASVDGVACQVYQTSTKQNAVALVEKYGAAFAVETEILSVVHIISPEVEINQSQSPLNVLYTFTLRVTLENGQIFDVLHTENSIIPAVGGVLTDCTPEDFQ